MMDCVYQIASPEAYAVNPRTGQTEAVEVTLCEWPDQHPERFLNAPMWLLRQIGSGLAINPERDCKNCPARISPPPSSLPEE